MAHALRIIDANANRAREALRVMEDAARFLLNDAQLSERIKTLRHDLAAALAPLGLILIHRDTPGDVGVDITTPAETHRASTSDVAVAAGKRLSEALRAIEEYAKTINDAVEARTPEAVEQLRYRGYTIERDLTLALARTRPAQWRICLLLTESLCTSHDWRRVLDEALDAGVDAVQLREKDLADRDLLARARHVVDACRGRAASIINDRPDIALLAEADGVHLGHDDLPVDGVRRLVGSRMLIGASTAALEDARRAFAQGADYCGLGPMFASTTKPKPRLAGLEYLTRFLDAFPGRPHLAISGINFENLPELIAHGARGVAVSSTVCAAENPGDVIRRMNQLFSKQPPQADGGQHDKAHLPTDA